MMDPMATASDRYSAFMKVDGLRMAATSGTAGVLGADGKLSSIISDYSVAIPADNPRFVLTVVRKDPTGFGRLTACPVSPQICAFRRQNYEVPFPTPHNAAIPFN